MSAQISAQMSAPMSALAQLAATFPGAALQTILGRLVILFLSGAAGDMDAARNAAAQMLAEHDPRTTDELRLAAEVISFSFHTLEALSLSAAPDITLNQKLRLRGSAVSLSRESHKSQHKLERLRRAGTPSESTGTPPEPARPQVDRALQLIEAARAAVAQGPQVAGKIAGQTWTQRYDQKQAAKRIAANLKKNAAAAAPAAPVQGRNATRLICPLPAPPRRLDHSGHQAAAPPPRRTHRPPGGSGSFSPCPPAARPESRSPRSPAACPG